MSSANAYSTPKRFIRSNILDDLRRLIPDLKVSDGASWNRYTTLGAGISSFVLAELENEKQLRSLTDYRNRFHPELVLFPLGGGSNLVGTDESPQSILFLKLKKNGVFSEITDLGKGRFFSGTANSIRRILDFASQQGYGGASGLYGIPGTIGGALKMNAGANGVEIVDFLESLRIFSLRDGTISERKKGELGWGYRRSQILDDELVLSAVFHFQVMDSKEEQHRFHLEIERRKKAPSGRSAGSVFRNPSLNCPAGRLLEKCGAKEIRNGCFKVSEQHANWIIRDSESAEAPTAKDFTKTVMDMMMTVYHTTGILLNPEVRFVSMDETLYQAEKKLKILVLKGGVSCEREISLESAKNVANALRAAGHEVWEYDIKELVITEEMRKADVVYPVLHGGFGEDGTLQEMLENAGIKFVGAGSKACRVVMDKFESKKVMDANGILNAAYALVDDPNTPIPANLKLPLIVKPVSEGSTFGLTLVETAADWKPAIEFALKYDRRALVEQYIQGIETTVGILLGKALPLIEIRYPGKIYDYDAKYTHANGETLYLCPPTGIPENVQKTAQLEAEKFAKAVDASDLIRVDIIIENGTNLPYVLEGNSMPGCTASSLLPKAAAVAGITGPEMCSRLAMAAYRK